MSPLNCFPRSAPVLGVGKKSFSFFDDRNLPLIYNSLIRPHLEYGNIVLGPFYKELVKGRLNINKDDFLRISHLTTRGHKQQICEEHATKLPRINTLSNRIVKEACLLVYLHTNQKD